MAQCTSTQKNGNRKKRFRTELDAKLAMARIYRGRGDDQTREFLPKRAYQCPKCHGWHLTHSELRTGARA